jgi:hypothetical protein
MRKVYSIDDVVVLENCCICDHLVFTRHFASNCFNELEFGARRGGTTPSSFANAADVWIIQSNMAIPAGTFTIAGSIQINSNRLQKSGGAVTTLNVGNLSLASGTFVTTGGAAGAFTLNITGNLSLVGTSYMEHQNDELFINLGGNLSVAGTAYLDNIPSFNHITFNNTSSTLVSPQTITWTSTGASDWTDITVASGCVVQLNSNVTNPGGIWTVNGTLVAGTNVITNTGTTFTLASGATLHTAHANGLNGTVNGGTRNFNGGANYIFNASVAQVTGGNYLILSHQEVPLQLITAPGQAFRALPLRSIPAPRLNCKMVFWPTRQQTLL